MKLRNFLTAGISLFLLTTTLFGTENIVSAQGNAKKPGAMAGKNKNGTALMVGLKAAELTEAQKDQAQIIAKKYRDERREVTKEMRAENGTVANGAERPKPSTEIRTKLTDIEVRELAEVKAILTPEQLAKFTPAYEAAKSERGNGGNAPLAQIAEKLALTDEQKAKITPILTESGEAMAALRKDQSLERRDKAAKMMELWESAKAKIRPLLTADQQKTFDEMKAPRGGGKRPGKK